MDYKVAKTIEDRITMYLLAWHLRAPYTPEAQNQVSISRAFMYENIAKFLRAERIYINVVMFNRVVDEMKKAGLVKTSPRDKTIAFTEEGRKLIVEPMRDDADLRKLTEIHSLVAKAESLGIDTDLYAEEPFNGELERAVDAALARGGIATEITREEALARAKETLEAIKKSTNTSNEVPRG